MTLFRGPETRRFSRPTVQQIGRQPRGWLSSAQGILALDQNSSPSWVYPLDLQIHNPWELVRDTRIYILFFISFNNLLLCLVLWSRAARPQVWPNTTFVRAHTSSADLEEPPSADTRLILQAHLRIRLRSK